MEPKTSLKRLLKIITKKDAKKVTKTGKSCPFLRRPKSEIGPLAPQKIKKGKKGTSSMSGRLVQGPFFLKKKTNLF